MPKPNDNWTVPQLKDYIRSHKLNISLNTNKRELVGSLRASKHWDYSVRPIPRKGPRGGVSKHFRPKLPKRPPPQRPTDPEVKAQRRSEMTSGHVVGQRKRPKLPKRALRDVNPKKAERLERLKEGNGGSAPAPVTKAYQRARGTLVSGHGGKFGKRGPQKRTRELAKKATGGGLSDDELVKRYGGHKAGILNAHLEKMTKGLSKTGGQTKLAKLRRIQEHNGLDTLPPSPKKALTTQRHHQLWKARKDKTVTWEEYKKTHNVKKQ